MTTLNPGMATAPYLDTIYPIVLYSEKMASKDPSSDLGACSSENADHLQRKLLIT